MTDRLPFAGADRLALSPHGTWGCSALVCASIVAATIVAAGCATNPATGQEQLNFYSKSQEIELGRQSAGQVEQQIGLVDDRALQEWVGGIGKSLAAASERPDLPWTFNVVDDPTVNAFALPGGFVYVTRGLLGHMSNDAELAGVMGHEIGHVTAQHSVNQLSKQQLATGGLLLGAVLSPEVARFGNLAQTGLSVLFLKFSRDDESQADRLGLRYMTRAGYDPHEMPKVFDELRRVSASSGDGKIPSWLSTHPDPGNRREQIDQLIAANSYRPGKVEPDDYFRHIDGLTFGADPRQGYFEGDRYYHPALRFQVAVPPGWAALNEASDVVAIHPQKVAQVQVQIAPGTSADQSAQQFLAQQGLEVGSEQRRRVNGLYVEQASFRATPQGGQPLDGRVAFVEYGGRVFELLGVSLEQSSEQVDGDLQAFLSSFAPLEDPAHLSVEPQRIESVRLTRTMTFQDFLRAYPSGAESDVVALANGIEDQTALIPAGTWLKRISGQEVGMQRIGPKLE
jgi:predicted Zn-dependent protease